MGRSVVDAAHVRARPADRLFCPADERGVSGQHASRRLAAGQVIKARQRVARRRWRVARGHALDADVRDRLGLGGVQHLAASGSCSWYEFTPAIMDEAGVEASVESRRPSPSWWARAA